MATTDNPRDRGENRGTNAAAQLRKDILPEYLLRGKVSQSAGKTGRGLSTERHPGLFSANSLKA